MFKKKQVRENFNHVSERGKLIDVEGIPEQHYSLYIDNRYINVQKLTDKFYSFLMTLETMHACVEINRVDQIVRFINTPDWSITIKPKKHQTTDVSIVGFKNGFKLFQLDLFEDYDEEPIILKYSNLEYSIEEENNKRYFVVYARVKKDENFKVIQLDITDKYIGHFTIKDLIEEMIPMYYGNPEAYWI